MVQGDYMILQTLYSAQQCFEQLLIMTLAKFDKLEAMIKQQRISEADSCVITSLFITLRQHLNKSQVWLVDAAVKTSPLKQCQEPLQALTDLLQAKRLGLGTHGAVGMMLRSLNTYLNLLDSQASQLRHQHLRQMRKPISRGAVVVH